MPRQASSTTGVVVATTMAPKISPSTSASAATTIGLVEVYRAQIVVHRGFGLASTSTSDTGTLQGRARHQESDGFPTDRRVDNAHNFALEHDGDAVAQGGPLVQLGAHDERPVASVAVVNDLAMDVLNG